MDKIYMAGSGKIKFVGKRGTYDQSFIHYNGKITLKNVPAASENGQEVGNRERPERLVARGRGTDVLSAGVATSSDSGVGDVEDRENVTGIRSTNRPNRRAVSTCKVWTFACSNVRNLPATSAGVAATSSDSVVGDVEDRQNDAGIDSINRPTDAL